MGEVSEEGASFQVEAAGAEVQAGGGVAQGGGRPAPRGSARPRTAPWPVGTSLRLPPTLPARSGLSQTPAGKGWSWVSGWVPGCVQGIGWGKG